MTFTTYLQELHMTQMEGKAPIFTTTFDYWLYSLTREQLIFLAQQWGDMILDSNTPK